MNNYLWEYINKHMNIKLNYIYSIRQLHEMLQHKLN